MQPEQLPAGVTMAELLQLAMNSSSHAVAEAVAHHVPAELEPETVRRLLVTAAARRHDRAVQHLTNLAVVTQQLDTPTIVSTLQELVAAASQQTSQSEWLLCIERVCALDAAAQLGSAAVAQLLLVALESHAHKQCIYSLSNLAAAAQLSSSQLTELLQAAVQFKEDECTRVLCNLPAAEQMSSKQVAAVLLSALQHGSTECAHAMLDDIPAVVCLTGDMLAPLMLADLEVSAGCTERLCRLPGRDQLDSATVVQLLQAAVQAGAYDSFELLIPTVATITGGDAIQLLQAVLQAPVWQEHSSQASQTVVDVSTLSASSEFSSAQLTELMMAAASLELQDSALLSFDHAMCALFCHMWNVPFLSSEQLVQVLQAAVQHGNFTFTRLMCRQMWQLPQLSSEQVVPLLNAAVHNDAPDCLSDLCLMVAGVDLVPDQVLPAVKLAVDMDRAECLDHSFELQAVQDLSWMRVAELLRAAVRCGGALIVEMLCELPAAEQFGMDDLVDMLEAATQVEDVLCRFDCMAH
jgi:hypothetical protein